MNNADALKALRDYYDTKNPGSDDEFKFTEALGYLIEETKDPKYMTELGWFYCSKKRFDLEIRYLEMAAEYGYLPAIEELGYMWYYGQHGETDYDKAFHYFSKGAEGDGTGGSLWCRYKLADMYHFGLSVQKDEDKYREMIEEAYDEVKDPQFLNDPFPEISLRLAGIRADQGENDEAISLLRKAKRFMAERLSIEAFWGHIEVMGRIVKLLYKLQPFDMKEADFYDFFYLEERPGKYTIKHKGKKIEIEIIEEDDIKAIRYRDKWYRSFGEFCRKADISGDKFTNIYDELYDVEVVG